LETRGFSIFNDREIISLLRFYAESRGLVVLTDSDGAGFMIRNKIKGLLAPDKLKQAYIPDIRGKEKRKRRPSSENKLGVEGMEPEVIIGSLLRAGATIEADDGGSEETGAKKASPLYIPRRTFMIWDSAEDRTARPRGRVFRGRSACPKSSVPTGFSTP
jgi:ribonuclease M5